MALVYRHRRLDNDQVFYIGMSQVDNRHNATKGRSKYWKRIVNKYGFYSEVLYKGLTIEEAKELEVLLISEYGRFNLGEGCLCNMTDGGDGVSRRPLGKTARLKISKANRGNNYRLGKKHSQESKDKIGSSNSRKVILIKCDNSEVEYKSLAEAERITGINKGNIFSVCKGDRKSAGGFQWKYGRIK